MIEVHHTADLTSAQVAEIRALLDAAFDGVDDTDFAHALGGMHALVREDGQLVAHGAVVARRLRHGERSLRTGYVEAVAVAPTHRRRGLGGVVMAELERIIRGGYELGALGASDDGAGLYRARGWQCWPGTVSVVGPRGIERCPEEDGAVYVLPVTAELDEQGDLACEWRDGDVW